jgi:hypothetical protein
MTWEIFIERSFVLVLALVLEWMESLSENENGMEDDSLYPPLNYKNRNPSLR